MRLDRTVLGALAGAAALVAGGGSALAGPAGDSSQREARCDERLARIAERRGVSVAELEAQIKARMTARVEKALQAGRIDAARAARLIERIAKADLCNAGARIAKTHHAKHGMLRAAAAYLGLTKAELRAQLPGTSLAALAQKQGKSVEGLETAMLAPAKAKLAKAVDAGRIPQVRADRILDRLEALAERLVRKTFPAR
jgi:hypothetical protein